MSETGTGPKVKVLDSSTDKLRPNKKTVTKVKVTEANAQQAQVSSGIHDSKCAVQKKKGIVIEKARGW